MKTMYHLIDECSKEVLNYFVQQTKEQNIFEVEMKDVLSRFANDVIASVAFGIECDSLTNKDNDFFKMGQKVTKPTGFTMLKAVIITSLPTLAKVILR